MSSPPVHWHEGMFLRPQHLQAADRHAEERAARLGDALHPYAWGCRTLAIDDDALGNGRFVVRRLAARLPDGSLARVPEDAALSAVDLKPALDRLGAVTVYLALPVARSGRANASEDGDPLARHRLDAVDLDDENTGTDAEPVVVRRPNLQLLTSAADTAGYAVLPLAKVEKSDRADGRPRLSPGYIPPVLACDAWPELAAGILQAAYDRLGRKIDVLAAQVQARGLSADTGTGGDALLAGQLRTLNEGYALLHGLAFTPGVHPLPAYLELCRLVGALAIFGPARRPPALPRYDHDDLGGTFFPLKRALDDLLDRVVEPEYKDRPFVGAGLRMQVELEPAWVEVNWQLYIAARSGLPADELVRVLTQPGVLDMKVGSSARVDDIFRLGSAGLSFLPVPHPPRALPAAGGTAYFQLAADPTGAEWPEVRRSLSLAVRVNEHRVVGSVQGERTITVQVGPQTTALSFTLYAVPVRSLAPGELVAARPGGGS
jgi:type VI secretion system protein ImpJ